MGRVWAVQDGQYAVFHVARRKAGPQGAGLAQPAPRCHSDASRRPPRRIRFARFVSIFPQFFTGLITIGDADRALGNKEGWSSFEWKTPDHGAATHVFAAFEPSLKGASATSFKNYANISSVDSNGVYLEDSHIADPNVETVKPWGTSAVEAERLWKLSEKLVGQEFRY